MNNRQRIGLSVLAGLGLLVCLLRMLIDREPTGLIGLAWPEPAYSQFRWISMANGMIAGATLGVSGVLLQALLRNPLASPFILGASSGAGLGVMVALYLAYSTGETVFTAAGSTIPATLGAVGTLGVVYALSQRKGWIDPVSLILIGVVVSTICMAGIMFFQHLVPTGLRGEFTTWLMGYIPENTSFEVLLLTGSIAALCLVLAILLGNAMDVASLSDDEAHSVGLEIRLQRITMFVLAGVLTAVAVAVVGPIGFVGLISPHVARLVLGPRHAPLVLGAACCGVIVLVGADVGRQALDLGGGRMPPGIFTALIGGPVFIWLLLTGRGRP